MTHNCALRFDQITVALQTLNALAFGIFGFWPLAFPDLFYSVAPKYCTLPLAGCFNL